MTTLRAFLPLAGVKIFARILFCFAAATSLLARDVDPTVLYTPQLKLIEGDQPLNTSYVLSVLSPANLAAGVNVPVSLVVSANSSPAGVSNAAALSFVSLSTTSLVFTGPNQTKTVTVTVSVPEGTAAGDYVWNVATIGWAAGTIDPRAAINAKVTIPQVPVAPAVSISGPLDGTVFNLLNSALPLSLPVSFTATAPAASPILSIDADINGTAIPLTTTGLGTGNVQATGIIPLSLAGVFTVRARATNNVATSSDTVDITVNIQAPAPTVAIAQPIASTFVYTGTTLTVPFAFTATSPFGGVTSLAATLNGTPIPVTAANLSSLVATGTGALAINAAGTYTLAVTGTSAHGTTSVIKTFTVTSAQSIPAPTVAIAQPLNGAVFIRVAGSAATSIPFAFTATSPGSTISSVTGALNGNNVSVATTGLGFTTATGTGVFSISAPGTYTFVAGATSSGLSGSKSVSFTVNETPAPVADCTIEWLPPISLGKVQKGGSVLPIKFRLDCGCRRCSRGKDDCDNERDTSVVIFVYEIFANGTDSEPEIFTYSRHGKCSRRDGTYEIDGNHYHLNYDTERGTHRYHVEVYRTQPNSTTPQLLGTKEFTTR